MEATTSQERWYAIQAKPRSESITAAVLGHKGYECFLPVRKMRRRWSDRFKDVEQPLFTGYLFCRMDAQYRLPVLVTPGVMRVVGIGRTPIPVPDSEIDALKAITASGQVYEPWAFLQAGQYVEIKYGPLRGLEGVLLRGARERVVVSVTLLQRSVAVEIESDWVGSASPVCFGHARAVTT